MSRNSGHRRAVPARSAVLAMFAASSILLGGCGVVASSPTTSMPSSFSGSTQASVPLSVTAAPEEKSSAGQMPVFWLGLNGSDIYLYREFQNAAKSGDPIGEAVLAMTSGAPVDRDYFTPWEPASRVTASISGKNVITVDISSDAFKASLDAGMAHRAVQQLVYTATAAASNAGLTTVGYTSSVVLLVDGKAGYRAFGHESLDAPVERDTAILAPIWVTDPREGGTVENTLTVHGSAVAQGGQLSWAVEPIVDGRPAEQAIESGFAELDAPSGGSSAFSFSVDLPPGEYNLRIFHGAGHAHEDSKRFTVHSDLH